jgi:hypothetical protein
VMSSGSRTPDAAPVLASASVAIIVAMQNPTLVVLTDRRYRLPAIPERRRSMPCIRRRRGWSRTGWSHGPRNIEGTKCCNALATSVSGQSRRFKRPPTTSGLLLSTDTVRQLRQVRKCQQRTSINHLGYFG